MSHFLEHFNLYRELNLLGKKPYDFTSAEYAEVIREYAEAYIEAHKDDTGKDSEYWLVNAKRYLYYHQNYLKDYYPDGVNNPFITHGGSVESALFRDIPLRDEVLAEYPRIVQHVAACKAEHVKEFQRTIREHRAKMAECKPGSVYETMNLLGITQDPVGEDGGQFGYVIHFGLDNGLQMWLHQDNSGTQTLQFGSWDGCNEAHEDLAEKMAKKYDAEIRFNMADESLWLSWKSYNEGLKTFIETGPEAFKPYFV